jgi:hypothetical protein
VCVPPTETDEERTEKEKKKRRKTIKFRVEVFSAFVLLGYFGVTILIWCASKKAAEEAKRAADTASQQVEVTKDALCAQFRPWLGIEKATHELDRIQCPVKNYGKAVARKVVVRAYWIDESDLARWEHPASHEEEYDLKFLKICDDAVTESRTYGARKTTDPGRHGTIFPEEQVRIEDAPISNEFKRSSAKQFIAVCMAYQGLDAALPAPTKPERYPLFVSGMFRTQVLYRTTPTKELTIIDADAFDPPQNCRVKSP